MQSIRGLYAERRRSTAPAQAADRSGRLPSGGRVAELERLVQLHDHGSLTGAEFAAEKAVLMKDVTETADQ